MNRYQYDPEVAAQKARNREIFQETLRIMREGQYTLPSGETVALPSLDPMIAGSECVQTELPVVQRQRLRFDTELAVDNKDCVSVAHILVGEGYSPCLLNFASAGHPGGGVENGARAQEESICRRSTLVGSLYCFSEDYSAHYGFPHKSGNNYPISGRYSAIYSPEVTFFRYGNDCEFLEEPFQCAVITCAALNLGGRYELRLNPDGSMPEEARSITADKIRTIFRLALLHGHDSLVLGAFGCGAFCNPPEEIAELFKSVLEEDEFQNRFHLIVFAILEDHNSRGRNFETFRRILDNTI